MSTLNLTAAKPTGCHLPPRPSLNPNRLSFCKPLSSTSFRFPPPPFPGFSSTAIKASFGNGSHENQNRPLRIFRFKSTNQNAAATSSLVPFVASLKTTVVTTIAATALFFSGFYFYCRRSIAAPISSPPTVETVEEDSTADEESEKILEEHLISNPDDVDGLKNLMEIKMKRRKVREAIEILDRLINLEPEEIEWPMAKGHLSAYIGEMELAKNIFNELLMKDPFRVEVYHGLLTLVTQEEPMEQLEEIESKIEEAMELCKKENKKRRFMDFTLLIAQIRVLEGRYDEALKLYEALAKEEPRDFRPYLCQGIVYTLLGKNYEAEQNFEKYRRLIPKGHPYASYFDDNMFATKIFADKMMKGRAMAKS